MTLFARLVARGERWIVDIDQERDSLARMLTSALVTPIQRAFIPERLAYLEQERAQAVAYLTGLQGLQHAPGAMFSRRPKHLMLHVPLRRKAERKEIA
jgi:hypothetical protein